MNDRSEDTEATVGSTAANPPPSEAESDTDDSTLRYLSAVADHESYQADVEPPVLHGPELVRDVMVTSVVAAHEGALFKEIVAALIRNRVSAVPVIDSDRRVLGVVSESDLLARVSGVSLPRGHLLSGRSAERRKLHAATARDLMTSPALVISPRSGIADAAWHAARSRVRRLPVVDDDGILIGIVSRSDLLRGFLRPDDEIRDDIAQNVIIGAFILDPHNVHVEVDEGVATLRGHIERRDVAIALVENVRGLSGVVDVDDELTWTIDNLSPPAPGIVY